MSKNKYTFWQQVSKNYHEECVIYADNLEEAQDLLHNGNNEYQILEEFENQILDEGYEVEEVA